MSRLPLISLFLLFFLPAPASALIESGNGWPINLGITGARADLKPNAPTTLVVVEVLPDTPAAGKLQVGDRIVGVNGRAFRTPHKFGYGMEKFGYEGPLMDFGYALEESQGEKLKGKFTVHLLRGEKQQTVELQLSTKYGQFAKTFPYNCPKTDKIVDELYAWLLERQKSNGSWHGRPHFNAFAALALLASKKEEHLPAVKNAMEYMAQQTSDEIKYGGLNNWKYGLYGVALAEYYLATKDKWALEELQQINRWLLKSQFTENYNGKGGLGGWGHDPAGKPDGNGYGPICMITAQSMAAWSLMGQCGIDIDKQRYQLAAAFLAKGTNNIGYVWYKDGNAGNNKYADMGRTGASTVAHSVSPFANNYSKMYTLRSAQCIGQHPNTFFDTHGSAILGMGWTALGAAQDTASFRSLMSSHVWFFNLSHCPDGSFYHMPNRDPNAQDYNADKHLSATAVTALIFSIRNHSLRITGAKSGSK